MGLSRNEIIELASRYVVQKEKVDFPFEGETFCLLIRAVSIDKPSLEEEGWGFGGYGMCLGYTMDEESKPVGKWLWMHFASLDRFPPAPQVIKLQPPHVLRGRFQNPERTHEIRILKLSVGNALKIDEALPKTVREAETPMEDKKSLDEKVVPFRRKNAKAHQ